MGRIIVVASGKGGTGKTTTVAAVSSCLAALGYKTLCIDCDAGLRSLDIALCMEDFAVSDFGDVLAGSKSLEEAAHPCPRIDNLYFLPAPAFSGPETIDADAMAALVGEIRCKFDYCLLDAPSGIGEGLRLASVGADMAIIVANGDVASVRDAERASETLRDLGVTEQRLVINRVRSGRFKRVGATVDGIIDAVGAQLIGLVCEDETVFLAPYENTPLILHDRRRAARGFLDIARRLTGESVPQKQRYL